MTTTFTAILLNLMISLNLLVTGISPLMPTQALTVIEQRYEDDLKKREGMIAQVEAMETRHQSVVERITRLKRGENTLTNRLALEDLLRQSKDISDQLQAMQTQIAALDTQLDAKRASLVSGLDAEMRKLEQSLASASATQRADIVASLNRLRGTRAEYEAPLPAAPKMRDLHAALTLADRAQDPDELLAAADELLDSESQVQRRLAAIDQRLHELVQTKRLNRRASAFSREERFFEETDRERVIARYEKTTTTVVPKENTGSSTNDDGVAGAPAVGNDSNAQNNANRDYENAAPEFDAAPTAGVVGVSDPTVDSRGTPTIAPEQDVFVDATQKVLINTSVDPSKSVGGNNEALSSGLDAQIDQLAREKARLKRQADALRTQAEELQRRAREN